jgi:hypothetical protein
MNYLNKYMKRRICLLLLVFLSFRLTAQDASRDSLNGMSYLSNSQIKVGIDLHLGGAITYVADAIKKENVVNNKDWGRQVQMSFYSGPVPYEPNGKKASPNWIFIGWNPIQSGDVAGNRSKIIECVNNGKTIYVKCIPMHWPLNNVPGECYFESWIKLNGNAINVHSRLVNLRNDSTQYPARAQELPAVYTNAPYHRLVTYEGDKPFANDTIAIISNHNYPNGKNIEWAHWKATENWAANLNENNYGLGVWNEDVQDFSGGYYGDSTFKGDSKSLATGYISPNHLDVLDHNIVYDYQYTLVLGTLEQIRGYVYQHSTKKGLPSFKFNNSRMHWYYENTTDAGWPIKSELDIHLNDKAAMLSPDLFWRAADAPILIFEAAYTGNVSSARIYWKPLNKDFNERYSLDFNIIPDGKYHVYHVPLNSSTNYSGTFEALKILLNASSLSSASGIVRVKSITLTKL